MRPPSRMDPASLGHAARRPARRRPGGGAPAAPRAGGRRGAAARRAVRGRRAPHGSGPAACRRRWRRCAISAVCRGSRTWARSPPRPAHAAAHPGLRHVAILSLALGYRRQHGDLSTARRHPHPHAAGEGSPRQLVVVELADTTRWRGPPDVDVSGAHESAVGALSRSPGRLLRACWRGPTPTFGSTAAPDRRVARGLFVSGDFFTVLGVGGARRTHVHAPPTIGRAAACRVRS